MVNAVNQATMVKTVARVILRKWIVVKMAGAVSPVMMARIAARHRIKNRLPQIEGKPE